MHGKRNTSKYTVDIETEEMNVLRSVTTTAKQTSGEYDVFG